MKQSMMFAGTIGLLLMAAGIASATPVPEPGANAPDAEARRYFTEDPDAPMIAPKGYDVTIVEYLDYQCPACRATVPHLKELLAKDPKVRVIFRDWPIFGAASDHAALVAVASKYQGRYLDVHDALFAAPKPLTLDKVDEVAKAAGVDWARLQKDMVAHSEDIEDLLGRNDIQAQMLGLDGTPGFIIGNSQSFGGLTYEQLRLSVQDAREAAAKEKAAGRAK